MSQFLAHLLLFSLLWLEAHAWGGGAGSGVCEDGSPGGPDSNTHGTLSNGNGGFSLAFSPALPSPSTYTPCTEYVVTLGGGSFVGFAISPLTPETGSLAPGSNSQALEACAPSDDEGLTHTSSDEKTSATGIWKAPGTGAASIRWTVLDRYAGKWFIETLTLSSASSPVVCPTPAPTPVPTFAPTAPTPSPTPAPPTTTSKRNDDLVSSTASLGPFCLALASTVFWSVMRL